MKKTLLVVAVGMILPMSVNAAGNGSTPKGKPFVEIQGQFVEVQNEIVDLETQISELTGDVNSLEEKVTANTTAIDNLKSENIFIEQQIDEMLALASANSVDIAGAVQRIQEISEQLSLLEENVAANAGDIESLTLELNNLRDFVVANTEGLLSLQSQMDNNLALTLELQDEIDEINLALATKQEFLNAECPAGSSLRVINQDGSFECETSVSSGPFGLRRITVNRTLNVPASYTYTYRYKCGWFSYCTGYRTVHPTVTTSATCPTGSLLESGGYNNPQNAAILQSQSQGNSWVVTAQSTSNYPVSVYINAECLQVYEMTP